MVGRDVQQHADAGMQRVHVLELEARELADDPAALGQLADEPGDGVADVAGDGARHAPGLEHRADQARRRRLAVRAGDADPGVLRPEQAERQLDLAPDRQACRARSDDHGRARRDAGALDDDVAVLGQLGVVPDHALDPRRQLVGQAVAVDQPHTGARVRATQRLDRRDPGAGRAHDEHARSIEVAVGGHRPSFAPGRAPPPGVRTD